MKKVDALTKSMEVEWKKMKRDATAGEKEISAAINSNDNKKYRNTDSSKRLVWLIHANQYCSVCLNYTVTTNNVIKLLQGDEKKLTNLYLEIAKGILLINFVIFLCKYKTFSEISILK